MIRSVFGLSVLETYNEADLRKRYRKLALLVHPDKNKVDGAEEAIKILNNALEVLLSQIIFEKEEKSSVGKYDSKKAWTSKTTTAAAADDKCSSERSEDANKRNYQKKSSKMNFVKEWIEEEKKFLAENLKKKVNYESRMKLKINRKAEEEKIRETILGEECEQRQKGIEERANSWKHFSVNISNKKEDISPDHSLCNPSSSSSSNDTAMSENEHSKADNDSNPDSTCYMERNTSQTPCCFTCNRQFSSMQHLWKHVEVSELHRKNLLRISEKTTLL